MYESSGVIPLIGLRHIKSISADIDIDWSSPARASEHALALNLSRLRLYKQPLCRLCIVARGLSATGASFDRKVQDLPCGPLLAINMFAFQINEI